MNPRKLAIVSAWIGPLQDFALFAEENHRKYAVRHNYDYVLYKNVKSINSIETDPPAFRVGWFMPEAILETLDAGYEYVFWMDMDSYFTNLNTSLEDLVKLDRSLVFTGDQNDICNGGHLLFRNTTWSKEFLLRWSGLSSIRNGNLRTSHVNQVNQPGCQIALVALLGNWSVNQDNFKFSFDRVNGWSGNIDRTNRNFGKYFAPVSRRNIERILELIDPLVRDEIAIVEWRRLNAYHKSIRPPRGGVWRRGDPILHLIANSKEFFRDIPIAE